MIRGYWNRSIEGNSTDKDQATKANKATKATKATKKPSAQASMTSYWMSNFKTVNTNPNHGSYGNTLVQLSSTVDVSKVIKLKERVNLHAVKEWVGVPERTHNSILRKTGYFQLFIRKVELVDLWAHMVFLVETNAHIAQVVLSTSEFGKNLKMTVYTLEPHDIHVQRMLCKGLDIPNAHVCYKPATSAVSESSHMYTNDMLRLVQW